MKTTKKIATFLSAGFLALALTGCGQSEEARENLEETTGQSESDAREEIVVGGFTVEGPDGREISVPQTTVDREAAEEYLGEVRPIVEETARDISEVVTPNAELQNQTLTLSLRVESIEEAQQAARDGLEELRQVQPPEDLEPIHEQLVNAYEQALPAYDNIIQAFESDDVGTLTGAVQESLPEIEQLVAQARAILQELERAQSQDVGAESGQ